MRHFKSWLVGGFFLVWILLPTVVSAIEVDVSDLPQEQIERWLDWTEWAVEGESEPGEFQWSDLNPKRMVPAVFFRAMRAYQSLKKQNKNFAFNAVLLFSLTHGIETASGPAYLVWGVINGVPIYLLVPTTLALLTQALPGAITGIATDLLCVTFGGTFIASPEFRKMMTYTRVYTGVVAKGVAQYFGVDDVLKAFIKKVPVEEKLHKRLASFTDGGLVEQLPDRAEVILRAPQGEELVRLGFKPHGEAISLAYVDFPLGARPTHPLSLETNEGHLKGLLKPFGRNLRNAVVEAYREYAQERPSKTAKRFWVSSVKVHEAGTTCKRYWVREKEDAENNEIKREYVTDEVSDANVGEGMYRVEFEENVLGVGPGHELHWGAGIKAVPGAFVKFLGNNLWGVLNAHKGLLWLARNYKNIGYYSVAGPVMGVWNTLKIGKEIVVNGGRAIFQLGISLANMAGRCAFSVMEKYGNPKTPPSTPF